MPMTSPSWYQKTHLDVATEFSSIQDWAKLNSMVINIIKTKEIIFYNPGATLISVPLPILGIERVPSAKLLGVYIQDNFSCDIHFKHIITIASQRLHILNVLKPQGLSLDLLHGVFYALIVNKITYAISAWLGFYVLQISVPSNSVMQSPLSPLNSSWKTLMTLYLVKPLPQTTPGITFSPLPSPDGIA